MKYEAEYGFDIRIWLRDGRASEIEEAIGMKSSKSHNKGDRRPRGDHSPYKDTFCSFSIFEQKETSPEDIIADGLKLISGLSERLERPIESIWFIVKILDPNLVVINLDTDSISGLAEAGCEISFENQMPS